MTGATILELEGAMIAWPDNGPDERGCKMKIYN
jgi:hypothetical protein